MKVFNYDSGFMRFFTILSRITLLNVIWFIGCIPLVTAGASTMAQYYATNKLIGGDAHVFKNYKEGFKLHWKRSTVIWLVLAVLCVIFLMDYMILTTTDIPGKTALIVISVLAFITLIMTMLWTFPTMVHFQGKLRELLFNAFIFAFMYAPVTLIGAAFYAIAGILLIKVPLVSGLILLFGQGLVVYCILRLFEKVFQKYTKKTEEN